eukprot:4269294-Alexandrium_andersonii.AAC.1
MTGTGNRYGEAQMEVMVEARAALCPLCLQPGSATFDGLTLETSTSYGCEALQRCTNASCCACACKNTCLPVSRAST